MASYNRVVLIGNLTRDVELRYTPSTKMAICQNAIAVNDRRKNAAGEWVDDTTFVDVTFFGRLAEVVGQYLGKGSPIFVEGRLKLDTWEKDGQKRSKLYVIVERMQLLGRNEPSDGSRPRPAATTPSSNRVAEAPHYPIMHDEMHAPEMHSEEPLYDKEELPF
ncbi:MAG: single-stranded DNA-binding protein [Pirellula sp.]|nr:single-stranded DNA-binding protein [Pirellula sp.]